MSPLNLLHNVKKSLGFLLLKNYLSQMIRFFIIYVFISGGNSQGQPRVTRMELYELLYQKKGSLESLCNNVLVKFGFRECPNDISKLIKGSMSTFKCNFVKRWKKSG